MMSQLEVRWLAYSLGLEPCNTLLIHCVYRELPVKWKGKGENYMWDDYDYDDEIGDMEMYEIQQLRLDAQLDREYDER